MEDRFHIGNDNYWIVYDVRTEFHPVQIWRWMDGEKAPRENANVMMVDGQNYRVLVDIQAILAKHGVVHGLAYFPMLQDSDITLQVIRMSDDTLIGSVNGRWIVNRLQQFIEHGFTTITQYRTMYELYEVVANKGYTSSGFYDEDYGDVVSTNKCMEYLTVRVQRCRVACNGNIPVYVVYEGDDAGRDSPRFVNTLLIDENRLKRLQTLNDKLEARSKQIADRLNAWIRIGGLQDDNLMALERAIEAWTLNELDVL